MSVALGTRGLIMSDRVVRGMSAGLLARGLAIRLLQGPGLGLGRPFILPEGRCWSVSLLGGFVSWGGGIGFCDVLSTV